MRWVGHLARMGASRGVYTVLAGKSDEKRPLERPRLRWEDNIGNAIRWIFRKWEGGAWTGVLKML